jgi:hypothetical protein
MTGARTGAFGHQVREIIGSEDSVFVGEAGGVLSARPGAPVVEGRLRLLQSRPGLHLGQQAQVVVVCRVCSLISWPLRDV